MKFKCPLFALVSLVFLLVFLPSRAAAAESGTCGDVFWEYADGTLYIYGDGAMEDYLSVLDRPWVHLSDEVHTIRLEEGVTSIGDQSFFKFSNLTTVHLPDSLTRIGFSSFSNCKNLTQVLNADYQQAIPDGVRIIDLGTFGFCSSLTNLNLGQGVEYIGPSAFTDCTSLMQITLSPIVQTIDNFAFYNCHSLLDVCFPDSVSHIGEKAFFECYNLTAIRFTGDAPYISEDAFSYDSNLVWPTAYYPGDNTSWSVDKLQNYGGLITWEAEWLPFCVPALGDARFRTLTEALDACDSDRPLVRLVQDATVYTILDEDVYIDLNGFDLSGTLAGSGKIHGIDSTTNSYSCEQVGFFNCVDTTGKEIVPITAFKCAFTGKQYMAIKTANGYSFHRFYLGITHQTLRPSTDGVGYKAIFCGDEMVAANLSDFGFNLQLGDNTPVTGRKSADSFVSGKAVTLRIDNYDVEKFGETPLYASAVMTLRDGTVIESTRHSMTLRSLMETLNTRHNTLSADHLAAIAGFIKKHPVICSWSVDHLI